MRLRTLELPPLLKPSDHDRFLDFCVPALRYAFRDDCGVGYFASGWRWLGTAQGWRARWRSACAILAEQRMVLPEPQ